MVRNIRIFSFYTASTLLGKHHYSSSFASYLMLPVTQGALLYFNFLCFLKRFSTSYYYMQFFVVTVRLSLNWSFCLFTNHYFNMSAEWNEKSENIAFFLHATWTRAKQVTWKKKGILENFTVKVRSVVEMWSRQRCTVNDSIFK